MTSPERGRFPEEVREQAIRLMREQAPHHSTQLTAIGAFASKLGCTPEPLWQYVREADDSRLTPGEEDCLKGLEWENLELRCANQILHKTGAFFAAAGYPSVGSTAASAEVCVYRPASA
jgi:transposase